MPESIPVPPFRHRLPAEVAARIQATAPRRPMAAVVLVAGILAAAFTVAVPAGEAQAMRDQTCGPVVVVDAFGHKHTVENSSC
ncbi:hypothetical protein [Blastococcus litoris]|uniref:hypothetical protein n=1 Tax=Blastococcus litoris TaxID=2171622 RepID=UPI0013DF04F5|nr:hypothetical protein [Blastococcus litoris]